MRYFLILMILLLSLKANSSVLVGSGFSSVTEGRQIPLLYTAIEGNQFGFDFQSVGVQSTRSFHSAYLLNALWHHESGKLLGGSFQSSIGGGLYYYQLGFKPTANGNGLTRDGGTVGPTLRILLRHGDWTFLGLELYYGIGGTQAILLSNRDVVSLIGGISF